MPDFSDVQNLKGHRALCVSASCFPDGCVAPAAQHLAQHPRANSLPGRIIHLCNLRTLGTEGIGAVIDINERSSELVAGPPRLGARSCA
jgi:hypothetical protein